MEIEVLVPDIGDFEAVDVIEVLVAPGTLVNAEDPLIVLESDKATMEIPAPRAGRVGAISVKVGDKIAEGGRILLLQIDDAAPALVSPATPPPAPPATPPATPAAPPPAAPPATSGPAVAASPAPAALAVAAASVVAVRVPELGDFAEVDVIEILVQVGDEISLESPLVTLESDKATMEIPAPFAGRVVRVLLKIGDKVTAGTPIVEVAASVPLAPVAPLLAIAAAAASATVALAANPPEAGPAEGGVGHPRIHAGPAMRRLARELGVDLASVHGSGRRERIVREDVVAHVKKILTSPPAPGLGGPPVAPTVDFSRFGEVDTQPLSKIRRVTGQNLHRAWLTAPQVTQFDEADITELEAFRQAQSARAEAAGTKLTLLAFLVKVVTTALARYPDFNASLAPDGATLIVKKYCHIGIAANTPRGLLVPVLRDANRKGLLDIAREVRALGQKARDGKLTPAEMQGGCFTISSLGGIGGTAFTPIINVPEVAILGVSPAAIKPVWRNGTFEPRLLLPLSLSYDHRVIDGVVGAEFTRYLGQLLGDIRHLLL